MGTDTQDIPGVPDYGALEFVGSVFAAIGILNFIGAGIMPIVMVAGGISAFLAFFYALAGVVAGFWFLGIGQFFYAFRHMAQNSWKQNEYAAKQLLALKVLAREEQEP